MKIEELKEKLRAVPWRKARSGVLVFILMALFFFGGYSTVSWYSQAAEAEPSVTRNKYKDWEVYKNETYGFGLRFPKDWEAKEVKTGFVIFNPQKKEGPLLPEATEGKEKAVKEYVSLTIASNKTRGKTLCEEDQSKCSFHTNGIFGERTTTPEIESVFFAHGEDDFTITLFKFSDSAEEAESYVAIFEEMTQSFRFTSQVTTACEQDSDCALGIRLDECCACAEAFTVSEIEANPAIVTFEVEKDYSGEKMVDCSSVYCSPCPSPPSEAVCVSNRCRIKE